VAASHRPRDATATHAGIGQHRYELTGKDVSVRTDATPTTETLWAKVLSEVFAPWVIVIVLSGTVAWEATHALPAAAAWGLLVALTSSVIPMGVIVWGARRGRWDGHHVRNREGRLVPLSTLIALSGLGLALLLVLDAPWLVVALDIAMLVCLVVTSAITVWWKVSMHAAVAAGAVAILAVTYTPWLWSLLLVAGAVGWSRVRLQDHTTAQVVVGSVLGLVGGGGVFAFVW